jgi:hypothetical protein
MSAGEALGMTAVGVEVRSVDVEADIPADAMPANCGEQDSRPGRDDWLAAVRVDLTDGAKQSSQTACVIVDSDRADGRQGHRAGVAFADPDAEATSPALSIAQPEAIAAASLTLESREAGLATFALAVLRLGVGGKGPTEVDGSLLEHLCGDLLLPGQACHVLGDRPVARDDEDAPGFLRPLPGIECVDEVEP